MKAIILLFGLMVFMLLGCKKGSIDDMYPSKDADIINQDTIDSEMDMSDTLDTTSTTDTTNVNLDSISLQNNKMP